jgi:hypothetical protein
MKRVALIIMGIIVLSLLVWATGREEAPTADPPLAIPDPPQIAVQSDDEDAWLDEILDEVSAENAISPEKLERQIRKENARREREALDAEIRAMALEDVIEHVLNSSLDILKMPPQATIGVPRDTINLYKNDAYISRLFDLVDQGSDQERALISERLVEHCRYMQVEMPEFPEKNVDGFQPTVISPGNASIAPILLAKLDEEGEMIEPILAMLSRRQDALLKYSEIEMGRTPRGRIRSDIETIAAWSIYSICVEKRDLSDSPSLRIAMQGYDRWMQLYGDREIKRGIGVLELIDAVQGIEIKRV